MTDEPFRRLGEALNTAWSHANFDELAFPTLASAALERARLDLGFSPSDYLRALMLRDPGVAQSDGSFGEPPIVPYRGRGFFIEVLYWLDATTDIHSHGFSGAFQVLHGASIHATYTFTPATRVRSTLRFGEVALTGVEQLRQGDVRSVPGTGSRCAPESAATRAERRSGGRHESGSPVEWVIARVGSRMATG